MVRALAVTAVCALTLSVAAAAKTPIPGFRSPTRNISCLYVPGSPSILRCDIKRASYSATLQDHCLAGPSVDWHGFELSPAGKGRITCSGGILYNPDKQQPTYVVLAYGKTWRQGGFACTSRVTGVTCRNRAGHGLFISRESWRAF